MTNSTVRSLSWNCTTEDRAQDQQQFPGFPPEGSGFIPSAGLGDGDHPQPVHGFPGLLLADPNPMPEIHLGHRLISLAVIGSDTRSGTHELTEHRGRGKARGGGFDKTDNGLPKSGRSFPEVVHPVTSLSL